MRAAGRAGWFHLASRVVYAIVIEASGTVGYWLLAAGCWLLLLTGPQRCLVRCRFHRLLHVLCDLANVRSSPVPFRLSVSSSKRRERASACRTSLTNHKQSKHSPHIECGRNKTKHGEWGK